MRGGEAMDNKDTPSWIIGQLLDLCRELALQNVALGGSVIVYINPETHALDIKDTRFQNAKALQELLEMEESNET